MRPAEPVNPLAGQTRFKAVDPALPARHLRTLNRPPWAFHQPLTMTTMTRPATDHPTDPNATTAASPRMAAALLTGLLLTSVCNPISAAAAAADDDPEQPVPAFTDMSLKQLLDLDVFTSASLLPTQVSSAPGTVYSFGRAEFSRFGVRRLDELLQFVPGLQLNQDRKRHQAVWARGMLQRHNNKLVLMVDGVRVRHLYYEHFSLGDNLPLEKVEKVEIILGPASSLYGANAFAGIISVTTRDFASQPRFEASLEVAANQRGKASLTYNSPGLQAFASHLAQDAPFREQRKSFIGGEVVQPLEEEYQTLLLKARPIADLTLALDYSRNDTPYLFIPASQDAFIEERALSLSATYQYGDLERGKIDANIFYQNDRGHEYELEQESGALGYSERHDSVMAGGTITGLKRLDNHVVALGLSWQHEEVRNMRFERRFRFDLGFLDTPDQGSLVSNPDLKNDNLAVYIQDVWDITPALALTVGARHDRFEQFDDYLNYRGAMVYTPNGRQTWKLLYGTAIRTPGLREYLKVLEGTSFQPPVPDAEHIESVELGYLHQWEQANISVNLFHNRVVDFIHETPTPDGADEYFTNSATDLHLIGAESLLHIRPTERLDLRLGLALLDADGDELDGSMFLASNSGSFNIDYNYRGQHHIGLALIYNSPRDDENGFADDAESFTLAHLFGSGPITSELSYSFGINNLFNRRIYDPAADFGNRHNSEKSEREIWLRLQWTPGN